MTEGYNGDPATSFELTARLWDSYDRTGATATLDRIIAVLRESVATLSPDRAEHVAALSNLGAALLRRYDRTGDIAGLDEAVAVLRQSVATLPPGQAEHVAALSNLGDALRLRGERSDESLSLEDREQLADVNSEAVQIYGQVLEQRRRLLGADHPATLASRNNLAAVLQNQGDLVAARQLHEENFESLRRVLGDDHSSTLASMNNLASVLQDLGDLSAARTLYERALAARRRVLGDDHPSTLESGAALSNTLRAMGDPTAAARIDATRMSSTTTEATLTVLDDSGDELQSLRRWLDDDPLLRRGTRVAPARGTAESMGKLANALVVALVPGVGAVAGALISATLQWMRARPRNVRVVVTGPTGNRVEISTSAVHSAAPDVLDELVAKLSGSLDLRGD